jgi:hypothetical protein
VTVNPFIELYQHPVDTLTAAAYISLLLGALVATWWAAGRNLMYLDDQFQEGWLYLIPLRYTARLVATLGIVAVDLWILAAIIGVVA